MSEDMSDVIYMFGSTYTVTRAGAVEFDTAPGQPTLGASSTLSILAVIEPPSGTDLRRMPEGLRTEETRIVWTTTELQTLPVPDTLAAEGLTWQVETVEPWDTLGSYFRYVVRKV